MPKTKYVWHGDNILYETDENDVKTVRYTYNPEQYGELISERRDGVTYTHYYDALGSTVALTDDSGDVTDTFDYTAWGEQLTPDPSTPTPFRWVGMVGYYYDIELRRHIIRRRSYMANISRWGSLDPMWDATSPGTTSVTQALPGTWLRTAFALFGRNAFAYCSSSPVLLIDPLGLYTLGEALEIYCKKNPGMGIWGTFTNTCLQDSDPYFLFNTWFDLEMASMSWLNGLPDCPCNLLCCRWTFLAFGSNPLASGPDFVCETPYPLGTWNAPSHPTLQEKFHPGACMEIRSTTANAAGSAQQCTYDGKGKLITGGKAVGTPDRVQVSGLLGSAWYAIVGGGHFGDDVSPFNLAILLDDANHSDTYFKRYLQARPPNNNNKCPSNIINFNPPEGGPCGSPPWKH